MSLCQCCGQLKKPQNAKACISRRQWEKIKKGSILISPKGTLRKVVSEKKPGSMFVTFMKVNDPLQTTTYVYHDIYRTYKIFKV